MISCLVERRADRPAIAAFLAALRDPGVRARITALGMRPSSRQALARLLRMRFFDASSW